MIFKQPTPAVLGVLTMALLSSGCCCMDGMCGYHGNKVCNEFSYAAWQGGCATGGACCGDCGDLSHGSCFEPCGGCGTCGSCGGGWGGSTAWGWTPDYHAMAAGWYPCYGPVLTLLASIRDCFATCGCGPLYYDEWACDPPLCRDPCPDAYGACGCGGRCSICATSSSGDGDGTCGSSPSEWSSGSTMIDDGAVPTQGGGNCNCGNGQAGCVPRRVRSEMTHQPRSPRTRYPQTVQRTPRRASVRPVAHEGESRQSTQPQAAPTTSTPVKAPRRMPPQQRQWQVNANGWDY